MNKLNDNGAFFRLIQAALWNNEPPVLVTQDLYEELKLHSISCLAAPVLPSLSMDPDLKDIWKKEIMYRLYQYDIYTHEQESLEIEVPYVILKGTAASQYYPVPAYRTMGDIDIMTRYEDLKKACEQLENAGFVKSNESNREIVYNRNGTIVELHRRFASLNEVRQAEYLDRLITDNINSSHILPDPVNGLTLLEHISQHLEHGLGIRQIIDWMMFADRCLSDSEWPVFETMVKRVGLEKLAAVTTRMCEIYLGLPQHKWCSGADKNLCGQLMEYVLSSGNFGNKITSDSDMSESILAHASTPKAAYRLLQKQGLLNWKLAKKYRIFRPFAWIYQGFRYAYKGIRRKRATSKIREEYKAAKKRNAMFDALGVKMTAKGIVIIKDGEYVKE